MTKDRETVEAALPYIRTILAFMLYVRDPVRFTVPQAYKVADQFTEQLVKDMP